VAPKPTRPETETPMKYLLLIYMHEQAMTDAERQDCYKESTA
jgi:hypothetical protein